MFKSAKGLSGTIEIKCNSKVRTGMNGSTRCHHINVLTIAPVPFNKVYCSKRARIQNEFKEKKKQEKGQ